MKRRGKPCLGLVMCIREDARYKGRRQTGPEAVNLQFIKKVVVNLARIHNRQGIDVDHINFSPLQGGHFVTQLFTFAGRPFCHSTFQLCRAATLPLSLSVLSSSKDGRATLTVEDIRFA